MRHYTDNVACDRVDDRKTVHFVGAENLDGVVQGVLGGQVDERAAVFFKNFAPCS